MANTPEDLPPAALRPAAGDQDRGFFGHPRGLRVLFFSEGFERFSYYGMRAILVAFLAAAVANGGMGFDETTAGNIYAIYGSMVYLFGIPGGWIADKFLGLRRSVFIGGVLIMCGHICLAIPIHSTFFFGLALIVLGTGLLKPNISAIVGKLYCAADPRRDSGFTIFYMGINLGAFLAPFACSFLAQHSAFGNFLESVGIPRSAGWHFGFGMAAIGMAFGLIQYVLGGHLMGEAGLEPVQPKNEAEARRNKKILAAILGAVVGVPLLIAALHFAGVNVTIAALANAQGLLLTVITLGVFGGLFLMPHWTRDERRRLLVILVLLFGAAVFWSFSEQAASTLSLFAVKYAEPTLFGIEFPAGWYQSWNSLFIVTLAPLFAWLWLRLGNHNPSSPTKFGIAMLFVMAGFLVMAPASRIVEGGVQVTGYYLVLLYFLHTCGELCLSPVGLSSMSRLAPASISGMVMGIWFLGSSVGNYMAGRATGLYASMMKQEGGMGDFFLVMSALPLAVAIIFFVLTRPIKRMVARTEAEKAAAGAEV